MVQIIEKAPQNDLELVFCCRYAAPAAQVFRGWTDPALLVNWFTPRPWKTVQADIDLRAGGAAMIIMESPEGMRVENPGLYLHVDHGRRLVSTNMIGAGWTAAQSQLPLLMDLSFEDDGDGSVFTGSVRHWTKEGYDTHANMGFHHGWGLAAQQLEDLLKTL